MTEGASAPKSQTSLANAPAAQVTSRPIVAVIGVLFGALISVFAGRLLSVGLPDLQGAIGGDRDAMNWMVTAYNAANMFIGPLTVFLGAIFGVRRILVCASVIFMLAEILSGVCAQNYQRLLWLQIIAGLSGGTFYPLTITVIVKNLPLKFLYLGISVYAVDVLASTNLATSLEAWLVTNLSWHWIFWSVAAIAPVLTVSIHKGVPSQPISEASKQHSIYGFLFASVGFTLVFTALDQGEHLDWWHSQLFNALLFTGLFFCAAALTKRAFQPHPFLNLKFLMSRNLLLLGAALVSFRFLMLGPTLLIPSFLKVLHGYRPDQVGPVLEWVALPTMLIAPLAAWFTYRADSRLICASGFLLVGISYAFGSKVTPDWIGDNFVVTQLTSALGLTLALTGLIASIFRSALALNALQNPTSNLSLSCWFQVCRLFGGEVGKVVMTRFLAVQDDLHYLVLSQNIDGGWVTGEHARQAFETTISGANGLVQGEGSAINQLGTALQQQVALLGISEGFLLIAFCAGMILCLIACMRYSPPLPLEAPH